MADANHPIWATIRLAALLVAMCFVLWFNASNFDATEIKAIITLFMTSIGIEAGVKALKGFGKSSGE